MSVITRDPVHRDTSSDDAAARPHGSFFGRRKGHKLRAHQADLIEHLLPRLALDIGNADRSGLAGRCGGAGGPSQVPSGGSSSAVAAQAR